MPLYVYECQSCGIQAEIIMPLSQLRDTIIHKCRSCGDQKHDQVIVPPTFEAWSDGRYFEHLGPRGLTFHDKGKYREHLKREGLSERGARRGMPGQEV